jgi:hypothetical protein
VPKFGVNQLDLLRLDLKGPVIGFTGTKQGMTSLQKSQIRSIMESYRESASDASIIEFHHGDCIGSDAQADEIAREFGFKMVIHPPVNPVARAFCDSRGPSELREPLEYLARDKQIAWECFILLGTPRSANEEVRSGTWATIRYARKLKRSILIVQPNGVIIEQ